MATICGNLWEFNLARVVVIDVTDDYLLMQPPLPCDCYPVLYETWLPRYGLGASLPQSCLVQDYLYDWHELPEGEQGEWYVGVVHRDVMVNLGIPA